MPLQTGGTQIGFGIRRRLGSADALPNLHPARHIPAARISSDRGISKPSPQWQKERIYWLTRKTLGSLDSLFCLHPSACLLGHLDLYGLLFLFFRLG
jgi:hypothetical protein